MGLQALEKEVNAKNYESRTSVPLVFKAEMWGFGWKRTVRNIEKTLCFHCQK